MTHTKGKLFIEGPSAGNAPYDDGGDYCICRLNGDGEKEVIGEAFRLIAQDTEAPAKANAQLWSVASDLLAACEAALDWLKYTRGEKGSAQGREAVVVELEATIAAARGN